MPRSQRLSRTPARAESDSRIWLYVALSLTFGLRLWFVLSMEGQPFSTIGPQFVDSYFYHRWAIEITSGNFWGSDVFFLRPLYPYLLALVYAIFGQQVIAVQIIQTLLATASCFLLYQVTGHIFGKRPAAFASIGFALTGILVFYTGTLLYVEVTVFLSLLFLWLTQVAGNRRLLWMAAGVSFGLLIICRPEMLLALPFLLIWLWRKTLVPGSSSLSPRRGVLAVIVAALAVIAVVPIRNYLVARDPVLFTAHSGINFYYGNNPSADGTWQPAAELQRGPGFSHRQLKRISRTVDGRQVRWSEASAYWLSKGLRFITTQPAAGLRLLGRKFLLFFSSYEVPNDYYPETARAASLPLRLAFLGYGLVLALALPGMFWAWSKRAQALPVYLFVAAYLVSAVAFYVLSRLRAPVLPFLLMFAGFGVSELVDAFRRHRAARAVIGIAIAVAAYVGSNLIPVSKQSYSAQAWTQMGNIYLGERKVGPAIEALNRALAAQPNSYAARYSLVMALAGSGKVEQAQFEFEQLARSGASSSEGRAMVRLAAARLAIARRDFAQAATLYRSALTENPDDAETSYMLGLVYISMDSLMQAREYLASAMALDPGQDAALDALKAVESRLGR